MKDQNTGAEIYTEEDLQTSQRSFVLLVTGGRNYTDRELVEKCLAQLKPTVLIEGGCPTGADLFAREWAVSIGLDPWTFKADFARLGPKAGPMRNRQMLVDGKPDAVLAFPGNRGTADMVRQAHMARVVVLVPSTGK